VTFLQRDNLQIDKDLAARRYFPPIGGRSSGQKQGARDHYLASAADGPKSPSNL
jgi:hypothetical protein